MNIYKALNEITNYIEDNLENKINYDTLAKFLGVNRYTMERLFSLIAGITLTEYIRLRRLSCAGADFTNNPDLKVMDVAIKYGYESATAFARAFEAFHGVKPSKTKDAPLKNYPQITFEEKAYLFTEQEYEIISLPELTLYGIGKNTTNETIEKDAPKHFDDINQKYNKEYGDIIYGMTTYDDIRENVLKYYVLYEKPVPGTEKITLEASKYLSFRIPSQEAYDIHTITEDFYASFLPSCKFNLKNAPELEYYHDDVTDFLVPID